MDASDLIVTQGLSRRRMLQTSAVGFGWLAASALLAQTGATAAAVDPMAPKRSHFAPRAKRVIFLLMKGGHRGTPNQTDFDLLGNAQTHQNRNYP